MNKFLQITLFILFASLAIAGNVFAQNDGFVETDDGFADSIVHCRTIGDVYK